MCDDVALIQVSALVSDQPKKTDNYPNSRTNRKKRNDNPNIFINRTYAIPLKVPLIRGIEGVKI